MKAKTKCEGVRRKIVNVIFGINETQAMIGFLTKITLTSRIPMCDVARGEGA